MTINNLFRCFITSDVTMLLKAYITYDRPKLEFATTVWNPGLKARRYNTNRQARKCSKIIHKEAIWYLWTKIY